MATAHEQFRGYAVTSRKLHIAGREYIIIGPYEYEQLLDTPEVEARFDADEYMPYWAEFWPASLLLADEVARWGPPVKGMRLPRLLELGCGLGIVGLVAHALGYPVVISDYDEDALAFVEESARRSGLPPAITRYVDWRQHYADLRVDRILAAEVTYESRSLEPIAAFVKAHLEPGGEALICDRNRSTADPFPEIARVVGLTVETQPVSRSAADGEDEIRGRIFRLRHAEAG